jgi:hypothetical protein
MSPDDLSAFLATIIQRLPLPSSNNENWQLVIGAMISTGQHDQEFHRECVGRELLQYLLYMGDCPAIRVLLGDHCYPIKFSSTMNSDDRSSADIRGIIRPPSQYCLFTASLLFGHSRKTQTQTQVIHLVSSLVLMTGFSGLRQQTLAHDMIPPTAGQSLSVLLLLYDLDGTVCSVYLGNTRQFQGRHSRGTP